MSLFQQLHQEEKNKNYKKYCEIAEKLLSNDEFSASPVLKKQIRLRRDFYDDSLYAYNENDYVNLYSVNVGQKLIEKFSNNWLYDKYETIQIQTCDNLGIKKSDCVIFGLAEKGSYEEYNRGGEYNRLCFSRAWDGRIKEQL